MHSNNDTTVSPPKYFSRTLRKSSFVLANTPLGCVVKCFFRGPLAKTDVLPHESAAAILACCSSKRFNPPFKKRQPHRFAFNTNNPRCMREYDMSFHLTIVQGAYSESLLRAWNSLGNYYWTYIAIYYDNLAPTLCGSKPMTS